MKKKYRIKFWILLSMIILGLALVLFGLRSNKSTSTVISWPNSSHRDNEAPSVKTELALWLLKEGRARLRVKDLNSARRAAELASFLDTASVSEELIKAIGRVRQSISSEMMGESLELKEAGNKKRASVLKDSARRIEGVK